MKILFSLILTVGICMMIYPLSSQNIWTPEKCLTLKNISATAVSPDASKIVYAVREALMTDERSEYIQQLWITDVKASGPSNPVQLTRGDKNSAQPGWSPDGQWISFVSNRDGKNNLYILPVGGGESEKLTDVKSGVTSYKWSKDGQSIALLLADHTAEDEEKNTKSKNDWYFMDEKIKQSRLYVLQLHLKDTAGKRVMKKLTTDHYTINAYDWSPDNKNIVYSHGKSPEVNDNIYSDITIINIETGKTTALANTAAGETDPLYSPDGKYIAYHSTADPVDWSGPDHIKIVSLADKKSWRLKATPDENVALIGWTGDGANIIVSEANKTWNAIYTLSADGKQISHWNAGGKSLLTGFSLNAKATQASFILQNPATLPQAYTSSLSSFNPVQITKINSEMANKPLPKTEVIRWKSKDGQEIEGLLTYPLNYVTGQKVPFLLNVHGGPAGVFLQSCVAANSGTYPLAALAEQGYAILRPNPRGSSGYGAAFRMANRQDWGGMDYEDLMYGVDQVIRLGVADSAKMGVMGWSYGGFMSSWIVGHTDRFKVASIGAPVVDLAHQNLTDDIEGFLPSYFKTDPWNDWALYDAHSPLRFVQHVKTPVLLQHGEADQRVPFSNAVMYYNALRRRSVPVRLLALPRQPHGPIEPRMVLKTMQTNVEWMDQYLMKPKS